MGHHYFEDNTELAHDYHTLNFDYAGEKLQFKTDRGVFSREAIDYGSRVLLEAVRDELEALEETQQLLDVGCGYGAMGLSLAKKFPDLRVDMVDVSERALDLARDNAETNRIPNVTIQTSDGYDQVEKKDYQHIISNPPIRAGKKVVHRILTEAKDYLVVGGKVTVVIQKKQGAPSAKQKMQETYGNVSELTRQKGYWILQSEKEA